MMMQSKAARRWVLLWSDFSKAFFLTMNLEDESGDTLVFHVSGGFLSISCLLILEPIQLVWSFLVTCYKNCKRFCPICRL